MLQPVITKKVRLVPMGGYRSTKTLFEIYVDDFKVVGGLPLREATLEVNARYHTKMGFRWIDPTNARFEVLRNAV